MKKSSPIFKQGFILLEAVVAVGLLAICIFYYQMCQLHAVTASQKKYQGITMLRVLYEEVRESRYGQLAAAQYEVERNGFFTISYETEPYHQAQISSEQQSRVIQRED